MIYQFILILLISVPSPVDGLRHDRALVLYGPTSHQKCTRVRRLYNKVMQDAEWKRTRCKRVPVRGPKT